MRGTGSPFANFEDGRNGPRAKECWDHYEGETGGVR